MVILSSEKQSKKIPNLERRVSSVNLLLPPSLANDDAGGGMTVKEAVITSAKIAVLIGALYVAGYFVSALLYEAGSRGLLRFFVYNVPIFPNSRL